MKKLFTSLLLILLSFTSFSQGLPLPYYTGFDSPAEQAGWQQFREGFLSLSDWSNSTCLYHDYNVGGNTNDTVIDWYVSPPLNFNFTGNVSMKVQTSGFSIPFPDNCEVYFGTGNPDPALGNFTLIGNLSNMQPQNQWIDTSFTISTITDSGYLALRYKTIGAAWMTYTIDSITASTSVGINNPNNSNNDLLNISPNPITSSALVQFNYSLQDAALNIFNAFGQKIKSIDHFYGDKYTLERGNLTSGIYFLQLSKDNKIISNTKFTISD